MNVELNNHSFGWPALRIEQSDELARMRIDLHVIDKQVEIQAELPGVKKQDIHITLQGNIFTVSATKDTESVKTGKDNIIWRETSSGSISHSFNVTPGTTQKDIRAEFSDSVLASSVPRNEKKTPVKRSHRTPLR